MEEDPRRGKAEAKAYRLLALRAHSEKELRAKILAGGFGERLVAEVIGKCRELGYLDDRSYARQRARELAVNRLAGDRRIAADLRERGIGEDLAREAIVQIREEFSEAEALDRLVRKRSGGKGGAALEEKERARLVRSLMGKGFPAGLVFRKLNQTQEEGFHGDDWE